MPEGVPRTERERAASHFSVSPSEVTPEMIQNLPPRGTGLGVSKREECMGKGIAILSAVESADRALGGIFNYDNSLWILNARSNIIAASQDGYIETGRAHELEKMVETVLDNLRKGLTQSAATVLKKFKEEATIEAFDAVVQCECGEALALQEHVGHEALKRIISTAGHGRAESDPLGMSIPGIVRDKLVEDHVVPTYDEAVKFSETIDTLLHGNDWLELYDGTTYTKTFEPKK